MSFSPCAFLRRRSLRLMAGLGALLHLGLAPMVAVADARAQAAASASSVTGHVHVEAKGGTPHRMLHGDDCALCQFLTAAAFAHAVAAPVLVVFTRLGAPPALVTLAAPLCGRGEPPTRAPPSLG